MGVPGPPPRRVTATRTGEASAQGLANTGVIVGDVHLDGRPPARSLYAMTVRSIAPEELHGREPELAELTAFARDPARAGTYSWWQADAWFGKSALLSWFVLKPPPAVRVVSFFITSRFAAQNDRRAFGPIVIEQLAELLGRPMPEMLGGMQTRHLQSLLTDAAQLCVERGENLLLVVDGLDEDRGVTVGPDDHSIAAMLPTEPPPGLRVLVSGRPNPPLPRDVPAEHPLRDPAVVRTLSRSPSAESAQHVMERELDHLLTGTRVERELLGFVTAAGGGLSAADLAELTGDPPHHVDRLLSRTVAGRSFQRRPGTWDPQTDVYVLAHEGLQHQATEMLGSRRIEDHCDRLRAWFSRYQQERWPEGTPEYLLRGYSGLLRSLGDVPTMVACGTDRYRHERMLDLSGGDVAALAEIESAQDLLVAGDPPDLPALVRLAVHKAYVQRRNDAVPTVLPAAWAAVGRLDRAEELARSIPDPARQVRAVVALLRCPGIRSADDRRPRLAAAAEAAARAVPSDLIRDQLLAMLVRSIAHAGEPGRAVAIARTIATEMPRTEAFAAVTSAMAAAGRLDEAEELAREMSGWRAAAALGEVALAIAAGGDHERAESVARSISGMSAMDALSALAGVIADGGDLDGAAALARRIDDPARRAEALCRVAGAAARAGGLERAGHLVAEAEVLIARVPNDDVVQILRSGIVDAAVAMGDLARAEAIADGISLGAARSSVCVALCSAHIDVGDVDRAVHWGRRIVARVRRAQALSMVAVAAAQRGDRARALDLVTDVVGAVQTTTGVDDRETVLGHLATAAATAPDLLLDALGNAHVMIRAEAFAHLALAVAAHDRDRAAQLAAQADHLARTQTSPGWSTTLGGLAVTVAATGDVDRAVNLVEAIAEPDTRAEPAGRVGAAMAKAGDAARAERLVAVVADPAQRSRALSVLAAAATAAGETGRARRLVGSAVVAADVIEDVGERTAALAELATACAAAGDVEGGRELALRTAALAQKINPPGSRAFRLVAVVAAFCACSLVDRAETLAGTITQGAYRRQALGHVVAALLRSGATERADTLARSAGDSSGHVMARVARAAVAGGDIDGALELTAAIPDGLARTGATTAIVGRVARDGNLPRAEALASTITDVAQRVRALVDIARTAAHAGDGDGADRLLRVAEALADDHPDDVAKGFVEQPLLRTLLDRDHVARAEQRIRGTRSPAHRVELLRVLAASRWARGDPAGARGAVEETYAAVGEIADVAGQVSAWSALLADDDRTDRTGRPAANLLRLAGLDGLLRPYASRIPPELAAVAVEELTRLGVVGQTT